MLSGRTGMELGADREAWSRTDDHAQTVRGDVMASTCCNQSTVGANLPLILGHLLDISSSPCSETLHKSHRPVLQDYMDINTSQSSSHYLPTEKSEIIEEKMKSPFALKWTGLDRTGQRIRYSTSYSSTSSYVAHETRQAAMKHPPPQSTQYTEPPPRNGNALLALHISQHVDFASFLVSQTFPFLT